MYNYVIRKLNPIEYSLSYANKGVYGMIFSKFKRPSELIHSINGNIFDSNNRLITLEDAITLILDTNRPIVVKASIGTYGGHGVRILQSYDANMLKSVIKDFGRDYVVQSYLEQSPQTARFNPSSLNTFRVDTLLLNGVLTVCGTWLRCGAKGSDVDNVTSGGMASCVLSDGRMTTAISYTTKYIEKSPTGIRFDGAYINHFDRVIDMAKELHRCCPFCAFVGWDIALDKDDEPVFIEMNLSKPDTWPWQLTQGPIFGKRTQEVMDYCYSIDSASLKYTI